MSEQSTSLPTLTKNPPSRFKMGLATFIFIHLVANLTPPLNESHAGFVLGCVTFPLSLWICYRIHPYVPPKISELMRTYLYSKAPQLEESVTPLFQQYRSRFMLVYYICLFSIVSGTTINLGFLLNRHADTFKAEHASYKIIGTHTEKANDNFHSNAKIYFAAVENPYYPAWIPVWSTNTLSIQVTEEDYTQITQHPYNLSITLHRGLFRLPWAQKSSYVLEAIPASN